ncbi:MAG TPA: hypothetical protein VKW06_11405 [Candidatus Angelobacter sp.]|nr:hypothetical protein [Candidatus Angelobacter sp.]
MFKRIVSLLMTAALLLSQTMAQPTDSRRRQVNVRKGVYLKLATLEPLDSATSKVGDTVPLRLARSLVVDDITLLQPGEPVNGIVTRVEKAGENCRYGRIDFKVDQIAFPDGSLAKSKVDMVSESPDGWVPDYIPNQSTGTGWDGFRDTLGMVPLIPVILVVAGLRDLGDRIDSHGDKHQQEYKCTGLGKEYRLPEGSTVSVWITKDHRVRY